MTVPLRTLALGALLLLLVGYASGKWSTVPEVKDRFVVVSIKTMKEHVVTQTVEKTVANTDSQKQKVVTIYRDREPTGREQTSVRIEYVDRVQTQVVHDQATTSTTTRTTMEATQMQHTTAPALPRWSVSAGVGIEPLHVDPVVMAGVSYRVAGPFSAGVWATVPTHDVASSAVGVSVAVAF